MSQKSQFPKWIVLQKKRGETPLQVLEAWKKDYIKEHPDFVNVPMSYAGRLDPMAEGKLLVLIGDECKKQDTYTKLDKEYVVELVLDVKTDTGDVLGFPTLGAIREISTQKTRRTPVPLGQVLPRFLSTDFSLALA
jgi:tRNA U55 pseudouridine synthase TruB